MKNLLLVLGVSAILTNSAFAEDVKVETLPLTESVQTNNETPDSSVVEKKVKKKTTKKTKKAKKANKVN